MTQYRSLLKSTCNTRELGGIVTSDGRVTKNNVFWRSDALTVIDEDDRLFLLQNGMGTIVDMRTHEEVSVNPCGLYDDERFIYTNIPITAGAKVPESVEAVPLSYYSMAEDICVMGRIFTILADAHRGVIFNCSAGKDRTGVVSAMLLMLAGVCTDDIADNYVLTKEYNRERLERVRLSYPDIDMRIVIPDRSYIICFSEMLLDEYGTVENYLAHAGLSYECIERLRNKLK